MRQPIGDIKTLTPIVLDIEPSENGEVLYQRVAPPAAGQPAKAMVFFYLRALNQTDHTVTARGMTISFPGRAGSTTILGSRDVEIGPGKTRSIWMKGGEEILLGENVPATIQVTIVFDGLAEPVMQSWPLVPHARKWGFFAKPEDNPDYGEYVTLPPDHLEAGGGHHFGYDAHVIGVNQGGQLDEHKTGSNSNEDHFSWGRPIYAMADGIVVRAVDNVPDNPAPGERTVLRKEGSYQGTTAISAVATANLSAPAVDLLDICRVFVAVISGQTLRGHVLEHNADGSDLNYLAGAPGPEAQGGLSVAGISEKRVVTAHNTGGDVRLVLWDIAADGSSVNVQDEQQLPGMHDARIVKLSSRRVAVLARTAGGKLTLRVHEWSNAGQFAAGNIGSVDGGSVSTFDLVKLTSTRLAAAVRTANHRLKVIVWDIGIGGNPDGLSTGSLSLTRVGEAEGNGTISELALAARDSVQIATAIRTSSGKVKLIVWDVVDSGAVHRRGDKTGEEGIDIDVSFFKTKAYAVGYRTPAGKLRLVAWETKTVGNSEDVTLKQLYETETFGTTDKFSMTRVPTKQPTIVTALRTQTGVLKVILWQFSDSNLMYILHGDEIIHFAHLLEGSIPNELLVPGTPVSEGQMVGRMGHSGRSGGPHLHIHSLRVRPELLADVDQLIADLDIGKGGIGAFRPLHFRDVRAMRRTGLVSGWDNNPMTLLNGAGTYSEEYAIWPAPGQAQQVRVTSKKSGQVSQKTRERSASVV